MTTNLHDRFYGRRNKRSHAAWAQRQKHRSRLNVVSGRSGSPKKKFRRFSVRIRVGTVFEQLKAIVAADGDDCRRSSNICDCWGLSSWRCARLLSPLKPAQLSWTLKCAKAVEAFGRCMTVEDPQTWQACCQSAEEGAVLVVNSNLIFERTWVQLLLFGGPFWVPCVQTCWMSSQTEW